MDIVYLLTILWRKKIILIALPAVSLVVSFFVTKDLPVKYRSVSEIATGFTTRDGIEVSDGRLNLREADLKFSNLISTMKTGLLFNQLTYRLVLHDLDPANEPFHDLAKTSAVIIPETDLTTVEELFSSKLSNMEPLTAAEEQADLQLKVVKSYGYTYPWINRSLEIKRKPNTDFIVVSFVSDDPELSAFAVNAYIEEFFRYYMEAKSQNTGKSVDFFERLVKQTKDDLDTKENALENFKSSNRFLDIDVQSESNMTEISDLESQKSELNSKLFGLDLRYNSLQNELRNLSSSPSTELNNQKILDLRRRINELNGRYINSGSQNANLRDSLDLLRGQLSFELSKGAPREQADERTEEEIIKDIENIKIEQAIAESRLSQINSKLRNLRYDLSSYASKESAIKTLEREVEVASDEYLSALNRYNEAKNKMLASIGSIKQMSKALPAASPESNKRLLIIAFSGIAMFGLVIFVIILMEVLDTSIKTPNQFQRNVDLRLTGSLVEVDIKKLNYSKLFSKTFKDKELETFKHFLRKIRYEIEVTGAKTFLITSPKVKEGKTFVIFALAYVLSKLKKRILIIDTNFKDNALTKWLSTKESDIKKLEAKSYNGLKVLANDIDGQDQRDTDRLIVPTKYKNIYLIGNSGGNDSPEEILHDKDFKGLMEYLKDSFDYIFLEGPAINEFSDTKELVGYVEKVLAVFSAGSSIKQLDDESIEFLKGLGDKVCGAVLNKVDIENIKL